MPAASLALLKGGQKKLDAELEKPAPVKAPEPEPEPVAAAEESTTVDVDKMSSKELDALVKEHEVEVPGEWSSWVVSKKRAWLKAQFEEVPDTVVDAAAEAVHAVAEEIKLEPEVPAVAETKTKGKGKGKAVATKAKEGELLEPDVISDLVNEIENLKEADAKELIGRLSEATDFTYIKLGGVLSVIQANEWYAPYGSFKEYVEKEQQLEYRKAIYWVAIYNALAESGVSWSKVKHLGWTKLKEIAKLLTKENVDQWVKIAEQQTTLQLNETVKNHLKASLTGGSPTALEDQTAKTVTTKTFKVHDDQKATIEAAIDKAKEVSGTTFDTVALEYICMDFLGGTQISLKQQLIKMGMDDALNAFAEAFPQIDLNVSMPDTEAAA